jgi:uncharacterized membrane protein
MKIHALNSLKKLSGSFSFLYRYQKINFFDSGYVDMHIISSLILVSSMLITGLGFLTSLLFVFLVGIFVSSWLGASIFWLGEWIIKKMPLMSHIYSASKQISTAISPGMQSSLSLSLLLPHSLFIIALYLVLM